jgi:hypothetical protein
MRENVPVTPVFSHVALLAATTTTAGVAMAKLGLTKGLLRARTPRRKCRSCGRLLSPRGCEHCGY